MGEKFKGEMPIQENREVAEAKNLTFDKFVESLAYHIDSLKRNNEKPTFEGAMANFLTSVLNKLNKEGGISVDICKEHIMISQNPHFGDYEKIIPLDMEDSDLLKK